MRLYEHEAADIFESVGIPVPRRGVVHSSEEAVDLAGRIGYPVMLKSQVLVGGRGLAGGIKAAASPEEVEELARALFNLEIRSLPVRKILVSEKVNASKELYVGIAVDGSSGKPVVIASTEGGVQIEQTAKERPEKVARTHVNPDFGFHAYQARSLLQGLGFSQRVLISCSDVLVRLFNVFTRWEALIAEINPLLVLPNGGVLAVDARMEVDNSALHRISHPLPEYLDRFENPIERKGREIGVTYVDLDGDIGLISSGAGLGMATMDIIGQRLRPANFLETGGGITEKLLYQCMELVMMKPDLRALFINVYGGINPIQEGARGVVRYIREHNVTLPVVAKALGNRQEETWEILRSGGVHVVTETATEAAVQRLCDLLDGEDGKANKSPIDVGAAHGHFAG
ncbi:MAG: succinyl-CoA synthetase subunit beta [Deltaproteobacteria bacterium HGW-Deltaproteobacteria-21]|nr:MAG: succinyl-CoA synthetase subunit beta [Deltaproteobacteria bacterium HGW-Deltaproteobacteria-21]